MGDNLSWEDRLPGWEGDEDPHEDYDLPPDFVGCAYCESDDVREFPEPFGNQPCCEPCFARLIGDESDDPQPFRCLNAPASASTNGEH